jgi:hypothetical protein
MCIEFGSRLSAALGASRFHLWMTDLPALNRHAALTSLVVFNVLVASLI